MFWEFKRFLVDTYCYIGYYIVMTIQNKALQNYTKLQEEGHFSEPQAKVLTEVIESSYENLATKEELAHTRKTLEQDMKILSLQLTVRLGSIMIAGITVMSFLQPLIAAFFMKGH